MSKASPSTLGQRVISETAMDSSEAIGLADALRGRRTILVTGGTGFIGRHLVTALASAGHGTIVWSRDRDRASKMFPGHQVRVVTSLSEISDDEIVDGIVNLAGEPIGDGVWTRRRRLRILLSRLRSTRRVVGLIARLHHRPGVLVNGSAVGWYGAWGEEPLTERSPGRAGFSHKVCESWELEASNAERLGTRTVLLRTGLVLDREGGMLQRMAPAFRLGLGARLGGGRQFMSWVHRDDLVRLIIHALARPDVVGPLNGTAPEPVTNREFTRSLGKALHRPAFLFVPAVALRFALGAMADELLLTGQRVLPEAAQADHFAFSYKTLDVALKAIFSSD